MEPFVFKSLYRRVPRWLRVQLQERDAIGWAQHHKPLVMHNGIDTGRELHEELLDALVYCHKLRMEDGWSVRRWLLWWVLRLGLFLTRSPG